MYKIEKGIPINFSPAEKIEKISKLMLKMKVGDSVVFEYDLAYKLSKIKKKMAPKKFKGKWLTVIEKKGGVLYDYRLWRIK